MNKVPVTKKGHQQLRDELDRLKNIERPRITAAIAEARAHGDLKENAEYHAAREQQGLTEARIRDLEHKLAHCEVIDVTIHENEGKVIFGATVKLVNVEDDIEVIYQIVGEDEADIKEAKLSVSSPMARAMIGKFVDEEIIVITPDGEVAYEIIDVEYR